MESTAELDYARPAVSGGNKVWAGMAILLGAIGLAIVGGCFLIGVMIITSSGPNQLLTTAQLGLMYVLYLMAGISFTSATIVFITGMRVLLRVARN